MGACTRRALTLCRGSGGGQSVARARGARGGAGVSGGARPRTLDGRPAADRRDRTFLELILGGAPIDQIAAPYGLTPRAVRNRCERLEQKIRERDAQIQASPPIWSAVRSR